MTKKTQCENEINIPIFFEKNIGQHHKAVNFLLRQNGCSTFFTNTELILAFPNKDIIKINLDNSNTSPEIISENQLDCKINYFSGSDKNQWKTNIPAYEEIIYKDIYPGIDSLYYENNGYLEHDFIVSPDANPNDIKMTFENIDKLELDKEGNISITSKENTLKMLKPKVYQNINGQQEQIHCNFIIRNKSLNFNIQSYNKNEDLIIDPPLLYGTYLGGNGLDNGTRVAVDDNGYAYVTGFTLSSNFPTTPTGYETSFSGSNDVFLIKINPNASGQASLLYGSYIGGNNDDYSYGLQVDNKGRAYISGITNSNTGFPITANAIQSTLPGGKQSGFIIEIDTSLSGKAGLLYGTYIGGGDVDSIGQLALDSNGYIYLTGITSSNTGFPITSTAYQPNYVGTGTNIFLLKIDPTISSSSGLLYGTYLGGNNSDQGASVAVDDFENAYITGATTSTSQFPITTTAYQTTKTAENYESYLIKIDTTASGVSGLLYGTYLGGNKYGVGIDIAVGSNQYAYITGSTSSFNFPTTENAYQKVYPGGDYCSYFSKIDTFSAGNASLKYSTFIGGNGFDYGYGIAVDNNNYVYITGSTTSSLGFPITKSAFQTTRPSYITSPYLVKIDTLKSGYESLLYGTYISGSDIDLGAGVAVDSFGNAYITGNTNSTDFPTNNAYQSTLQSNNTSAFLVKLNTLVCDLVLEKSTCVCTAKVGEKVPYTIKIINNGPDVATNVVVTDILEESVRPCSYSTSVGDIVKLNDSLIWTIPTLQPGEKAIAVIKILIRENCDYIINTATATSDNNIINLYSATDTNIIPVDTSNNPCPCEENNQNATRRISKKRLNNSK